MRSFPLEDQVALAAESVDGDTYDGYIIQDDWSGGMGPGESQFESSEKVVFDDSLSLTARAISGTLTSRVFDTDTLASFSRVKISRTHGLAPIPDTTNLLPNASFEWGEQGSLDHWEATAVECCHVLTSTLVSTPPLEASAGKWAYLGWGHAAGLRASDPVSVSSNLTYTLSVDFRVVDAAPGTLTGSATAYDVAGREIGEVTAFDLVVASAEWQRYSGVISFTSRLSEVASVRPRVAFGEQADPAHFSIDAIQLEQGGATSFHEGYNHTMATMYVRTGSAPAPDSSWSRWQKVSTYVPTELSNQNHLQYQIRLSRSSPDIPSPIIDRLEIGYTTPALLDWPVDGRDLQRTSFQPGASDIGQPFS